MLQLKQIREITRDNGTEIKLIAECWPCLFGKDAYVYYALVKEKGEDEYKLFQDDTLLSVVTPAEVLKLGDELFRKQP
jgi:IS30 family transposase